MKTHDQVVSFSPLQQLTHVPDRPGHGRRYALLVFQKADDSRQLPRQGAQRGRILRAR